MKIAFESFKAETGEEPCLIAWIHSHVGSVECNFSSVDLHTQLSHSKIYDGILGLVLEILENGQLGRYDFFELSRSGKRHVQNCSRKVNCNSRVPHVSCDNSTYYQSAKTKVVLHKDSSLEVRNFMVTALYHKSNNDRISDHDDEDFEDENTQRGKKRKFSSNESQDNFDDKPSFEIGKEKRKVAKKILKARKTLRISCEFCGKNVAASWLISHIEKSKSCKEKCGEDLSRMKMEKVQEKKIYDKNLYKNNAKKREQNAKYDETCKEERAVKAKHYRQEKLDKLTKKDRYLNFKRSIIDGPNLQKLF